MAIRQVVGPMTLSRSPRVSVTSGHSEHSGHSRSFPPPEPVLLDGLIELCSWLDWPCRPQPSAVMLLCPYHEERTPSCAAYPDGYYCFGCHQLGPLPQLAEALLERCSPEQVRQLRQLLGSPHIVSTSPSTTLAPAVGAPLSCSSQQARTQVPQVRQLVTTQLVYQRIQQTPSLVISKRATPVSPVLAKEGGASELLSPADEQQMAPIDGRTCLLALAARGASPTYASRCSGQSDWLGELSQVVLLELEVQRWLASLVEPCHRLLWQPEGTLARQYLAKRFPFDQARLEPLLAELGVGLLLADCPGWLGQLGRLVDPACSPAQLQQYARAAGLLSAHQPSQTRYTASTTSMASRLFLPERRQGLVPFYQARLLDSAGPGATADPAAESRRHQQDRSVQPLRYLSPPVTRRCLGLGYTLAHPDLPVALVEGPFDLLACLLAGWAGIAFAGTPGKRQILLDALERVLLDRENRTIIFAFDGDAAGQQHRQHLQQLLPRLASCHCLQLHLPPGGDPADLARTLGARAMSRFLEAA
jgi:hypothetical protein